MASIALTPGNIHDKAYPGENHARCQQPGVSNAAVAFVSHAPALLNEHMKMASCQISPNSIHAGELDDILVRTTMTSKIYFKIVSGHAGET